MDRDGQDEATTPLLGSSSSSSSSKNSSRNSSRNDDSDSTKDSRDPGWQAELRLLAAYSLPLVGTYLLQYSFTVITTMVAGRLGADDLAAASIGVTTMNIFGLAVFEGMATALDTLCAQAYGAGQHADVGRHVQRMLLLMAVVAVPVGGLWLASPLLLPHLLRQPGLAAKAGSFLRLSLIGLPGYAAFEAGKRFLQAQGSFRAAMAVLLVCAPVNALLSWLFAFRLGMGLDGAALGAALANNLRPVLLLLYVVFAAPWSHACWPGGGPGGNCYFDHQPPPPALTLALDVRHWAPMVRLAVAGAAVTLAEWAAFEILTFSTSYVTATHLAAQTVLTTTSVVLWHVPFSVSVAVSTRIGHLVGAGLVPAARRAAALYAVVFLAIGLLDGLLLVSLRNYLPRLFSDDAPVCAIATRSMLAVAAFQIVDAVNCGCNGVLRGLGRQSLAAWLVFFINYFAAVPLAIWLELGSWHMELNGVWIGLGLGMTAIAVAECGYIKLTDWKRLQ